MEVARMGHSCEGRRLVSAERRRWRWRSAMPIMPSTVIFLVSLLLPKSGLIVGPHNVPKPTPPYGVGIRAFQSNCA